MFLEKLIQHASDQPDAEAIADATGSLSYRALADAVTSTAAALQQAGVSNASIVGLAIADEAENLVATLALLAIGASQINIARHDTHADIVALIRHIGITVMLAEKGRSISECRCIDWPLEREPAPLMSRVSDRIPRVYLSTTGTTGVRRLIALSEHQLSQQALRHPEYAGERLLRLAPIEFNTSKRHRLYCVWQGGTNLFCSSTTSEQLIEFVERFRVTCLDLSRMHLADLVRAHGRSRLAGVKIRPGGGPVPKSLRALVKQQVSPHLCVRYATTETGAIAMTAPGDEDSDNLCGFPLRGVHIEILNQRGQRCLPDEHGAVRVKTEGMVANYYLGTEAFSGKGWHEGWFYPGDVGWVDAQGRLHILGRTDDLINLNGIKIAPDEIEAALCSEDGVNGVAAFGISSAVHGQLPVAILEMDKAQSVSLEILLQRMREKLGVRAPRKLRVVASIPRNEQGKIVRRDLPALWKKMDKHD